MYKITRLKNGLTVVTTNMPHMESVALGVWIAVGGRYEKKEYAGISHFLEHMAFKGTKKRSYKQLKEEIEGKGGVLNGFTGEECTCYLAKVPAKHLLLALDMLTDIVVNPRLDVNDFIKEKAVILEEIKMYLDMPNYYVQELLAELMWPNHPLGWPLIGTLETVSSLTRNDLIKYKENYYVPQNIVIAIAGRLKIDGIFKFLKRRFNKRFSYTQKSSFIEANQIHKKPRFNFYYKDTEQTHLAIGVRGFGRFHPDRYALDILNVILGGNMSSRLFNEVREKRGLAYEIHSLTKHYYDTGAVVINAGIDNAKIPQAVDVIINELRKIKKIRNIKKEEFRRAIEFYKGQLLMLSEETSSLMVWLGERVLCGEKDLSPKQILSKLNKITIERLYNVAQRLFTSSNISLAVVGPQKAKLRKSIEEKFSNL